MNASIELGTINTLRIDRITSPGIFLAALNGDVVLLPNRYVTDGMHIDELINVFIYTDSEDRLVATTQFPSISVNEFGAFRVVDVVKFGVFIDIGLPKHILLPKNRQIHSCNVGDLKIIYLLNDTTTNRLVADERIERYFSKNHTLSLQEAVNILFYSKTPLGYKVIVNNMHEAIVFKNEIFEPISIGDTKVGYVKNIREDKKIDITLSPKRQDLKLQINTSRVLNAFIDGFFELNTKSDPDVIYRRVGLSKKMFKSAINELLHTNQIIATPDGFLKRV